MTAPPRPFDDIRALVKAMPGPDEAAVAAVRAREAELTKPAGSLGRLEEIAEWLAAWQGGAAPCRPAAGRRLRRQSRRRRPGRLAYPPSVTQAMVANFAAGGAAINQICKTFDISLKVYELAWSGRPATSPASRRSRRRLRRDHGVRHGGARLQTRPAVPGRNGHRQHDDRRRNLPRALRRRAEDWVGRGAGVDDAGMKRKAEAVRAAVALHGQHLSDPLEALRRLGGRESRRSPAPSSPLAFSACRCCSTASSRARRRRFCRARRPARSTIASPHSIRRKRPCRGPARMARRPLSTSACGSAKARARRWRWGWSARRSPATTAWRPSPRRAWPANRLTGVLVEPLVAAQAFAGAPFRCDEMPRKGDDDQRAVGDRQFGERVHRPDLQPQLRQVAGDADDEQAEGDRRRGARRSRRRDRRRDRYSSSVARPNIDGIYGSVRPPTRSPATAWLLRLQLAVGADELRRRPISRIGPLRVENALARSPPRRPFPVRRS